MQRDDSLAALLDRFNDQHALVVGDVMLDEHIWGIVSRISPEAPVPVVDVQQTTWVPGGAANAAANLASIGAQVTLIGVVGADEAGDRLEAELAARGVRAQLVREPGRMTTRKTRVVAHNQQVVRIDREHRTPVLSETEQALRDVVEAALPAASVVLVSDYAKGVITAGLAQRTIEAANRLGKPVLVDPKGNDYSKYRGATLVKPNEMEASIAANTTIRDDAELERVMALLLDQVDCQAILVSRGPRGLSFLERGGLPVHLPTFAREVYDGGGAGDTMVAGLAVSLAAGADLLQAANLANHAAGIVVGKIGIVAITQDELRLAVARD